MDTTISMTHELIQTISPVDNSVYHEQPLTTEVELITILEKAKKAQRDWSKQPIATRISLCNQIIYALMSHQVAIAEELSWQMGRPLRYTPGEMNGFAERASFILECAERKLETITIQENEQTKRFIRREPLGIAFMIVPWNYPYLTAVNSLIPALVSGNAVLIKPSMQTPLTADRIVQACKDAGLPAGICQQVFLNHDNTLNLVKHEDINFVSFTGSIAAGKKIEQAASGSFIDINLELGAKDPAYVCQDANLDKSINQLVDGVFFNSGQSCCAVERLYVHKSIYDDFLQGFLTKTNSYKLASPLLAETTLGPMVSTDAANFVREEINRATSMGATACIDSNLFAEDEGNTAYLAPQVLTNVNHSMSIMKEESFGPVVGIMSVDSDSQAVEFMNDSRYGLTASIWTNDFDRAARIGDQLQTGTVFMNRCDYLDPALAWTGVKDSGKGYALSELSFERLTQPKSFYMRTL